MKREIDERRRDTTVSGPSLTVRYESQRSSAVSRLLRCTREVYCSGDGREDGVPRVCREAYIPRVYTYHGTQGGYIPGHIPPRVPGRLHTLHIHHLGYNPGIPAYTPPKV